MPGVEGSESELMEQLQELVKRQAEGRGSQGVNRITPMCGQAEAPMNPIPAHLQQLRDEIEGIRELVEAARKRFAPVLCDAPEIDTESPQASPSAECELGQQLLLCRLRVSFITLRLRDLLNRCEL